jgi:hypothetical protein
VSDLRQTVDLYTYYVLQGCDHLDNDADLLDVADRLFLTMKVHQTSTHNLFPISNIPLLYSRFVPNALNVATNSNQQNLFAESTVDPFVTTVVVYISKP